MNTEIIGREREIKKINRLLNSNSSEFLAVYGRRRVGKTFLIREYLKDKMVFSFSGAFEADSEIQLENFFREYSSRTNGKKETTPPKNWSTAFSYLADYIKSLRRRKNKLVVFIDELPWLDQPKSGFVGALEYFWNKHISEMNNVLLIVCGSAASWMQQKILRARGGLYNRVTARIKLKPFTLYETEKYCKSKNIKLSRYQIVQIYMAMGGIPFYLRELKRGKSASQLIDEICFTSNGLLSNEYDQLYYSLFKNAEHHIALVEALANKPNGMTRTELVKKSGLPDGGTFNRTLNDLIESDFVAKFQPFNKKKKDSLFRLVDLYSLFYLKFIKGNVNDFSNTWQKIENQSSFRAWSGYAYENIAMLHIRQILKTLGLSGIYTEVSSWFYKGDDEVPGAQIDLLIDRKDEVVNLCEVKFSSNEYILSKKDNENIRLKQSVFKHVTRTKKLVLNTLITTYPAMRNKHYLEQIDSEITFEDLFEK